MKRIILVIIVVSLIGSSALAIWIYRDLHKSIAHNKVNQYIEIPRGSSTAFVVKKLATEGIIKHEWPLILYLKSTGSGSTIRAGEYTFPSPISPLAVLGRLQRGERRLTRLTTIEGWTRWDIAKAMVGARDLK